MRKISILGSTGSIGVNALGVIRNMPEKFKIVHLTGNLNYKKMIDQGKEFLPKTITMIDEEAAEKVKIALRGFNIDIFSGRNKLLDLSGDRQVDLVLNSLVGASGMEPTLTALQNGVDVALSNKESLVVAGDLIYSAMKKSGANLFPVDSEHSAIWQCLFGENEKDIEKIILTGSGGPFRTRPIDTFSSINKNDALKHPNWVMGQKITIDDIYSQTSMNYPEVYRTEMKGETIKNLLEDVCDNIFNPDPFFQQGGDMVRNGGMTYTCQPKKIMGNRISDLKLSNGEKIESQKKYTIGGWGSINPDVKGPPIYKLLEEYV